MKFLIFPLIVFIGSTQTYDATSPAWIVQEDGLSDEDSGSDKDQSLKEALERYRKGTPADELDVALEELRAEIARLKLKLEDPKWRP